MFTKTRNIFICCLLVLHLPLNAMTAPPNKPPADATVTESGLAHQRIQASSNTSKPLSNDLVTVHYTGWLASGQMFDSSVERGQPVTFPLDKVIKGWSEGLQLMTVGEKRRFWIPAKLGYGDNPRPGAPQGELIFDIELLAIKKPLPAPATPENLQKAPDSALTTPSGLATLVIKPGTGKVMPRATSVVKVHYSGWTSDGKLFDSSVTRDEPLIFPVDRVIPGWSEGVKLMTVGEKRRMWVPANLAYGENPPNGAPAGLLVFDVELLEILNL